MCPIWIQQSHLPWCHLRLCHPQMRLDTMQRLLIVGHITGDVCLKSAGAAIVSAVSAQAKIDSALFAPGASFINANGERYVEIT